MSILIRGMEMPNDKAVVVVIHPDGTAYTAKMFAGVCTEYLADCTAVQVPPHGDLIDRDELLTHRFAGVVGVPEKSSYMVGWNSAIEAMHENAPTIIPAEEGET